MYNVGLIVLWEQSSFYQVHVHVSLSHYSQNIFSFNSNLLSGMDLLDLSLLFL